MSDFIEKQIELRASSTRVWRALTDFQEFGAWFGVKLEKAFVVGKPSEGFITYPGYEHLRWKAVVQKMEAETLFSFTWHPYAVDPAQDYSQEQPTLVEFRLEKRPHGTLLTVRESGFDKLPPQRRDLAFRMNEGGWTEQCKNIERYLSEGSLSKGLPRKDAAVAFLKMVANREIRAAYDRFIAPEFIHHNQYFKGDRQSLMIAMEAAAEANPNKLISVKKVLEDADTVMTFSRVQQHPDDLGGAVVHLFRFEGDKVVELWDLGQALIKDSPNEHGAF